MKDSLKKYLIKPSSTILEAFKGIDENKKGFLLVVEDEKLLGTLTDGDIRRAFIEGKNISDTIDNVYIKKCKTVSVEDGIGIAIELFKNGAVKFLPIVNKAGNLLNVITKGQVHALLLQDLQMDLLYDFEKLDESIVDYEIYQRPWGFYKTTVLNDFYQAKVITVYPNSQLSLQSHNRREEHWIVVHGIGKVQIDDSFIDVRCGSSLFIPKGCKHRLINLDDKQSLIISEVQIGDYLGEDDIVRYEDDYGRA